MPAKKIKVIIADDSAFMRLLITDIISSDSKLEVIAAAENGKEAAKLAYTLKPDVLVLDMNMGEFGGLYAVEEIMKKHPIPILILSSIGNSSLSPIFEALRLGAVDYINKPEKGNSKVRDISETLIQKVINVSKANPKKLNDVRPKLSLFKRKERGSLKYEIIVVGASTGGPSAIEEIVSLLPGSLPVPVIICQHMPPNFIQPFVNRLNNLSELNIVLAKECMIPEPGMVIVAPGNTNMIVKSKGRNDIREIAFTEEKFSEYNYPSINAIMLSAVECYGKKMIGVILTGMGKDGAKGMAAIKERGGYTIAQDKESCIIYGMPKVAIESNAIDEILDIKEISKHLLSKL